MFPKKHSGYKARCAEIRKCGKRRATVKIKIYNLGLRKRACMTRQEESNMASVYWLKVTCSVVLLMISAFSISASLNSRLFRNFCSGVGGELCWWGCNGGGGNQPGRQVNLNIGIGSWPGSWELFSLWKCKELHVHLVWGCRACQTLVLLALGFAPCSGAEEKCHAELVLAEPGPLCLVVADRGVWCGACWGGGDPRWWATQHEYLPSAFVSLTFRPGSNMTCRTSAGVWCTVTECCWESHF